MWTSGKVGKIMLGIFLPLCVLPLRGVSGADTDRVSVSVMEGDSVTLNTGVKINHRDRIEWFFNHAFIAKIIGNISICTDIQCEDGDERFRDRLKLDHQTGSLTIMNTRNTDSGVYELLITSSISNTDSLKIFNVTVSGASAAELDEVKTVKEGESVTLDPGVMKNPNDEMTWYFNDILIAEITGYQSKICTDVQCSDDTARFRDRLKLDHQTGSLTITNTRNTDDGLYKLEIISRSSSSFSIRRIKSFSVSVIDSGLSSAAVAGICVAVVVVVVVLVAAAGVIYYRSYRRSQRLYQNGNCVVYSSVNQNVELPNGTSFNLNGTANGT